MSGTAPRTRRGWPAQSLALLVTAVTMLAWVGLWAAVFFPLIMFNDADNGRFGHDIRTLWVPEVAPATATAIVLLVIAGIGRQRPLGRAALAGSALLVAATLTISAAAMALHHP